MKNFFPIVIIFFSFTLGCHLESEEKERPYVYSSDWVSPWTDSWTKLLAPIKGKPNQRAIEIGSFEGRSAIWFLDNILTHPSSTLTCIDIFPYKGLEARFKSNISKSGHKSRVISLKGKSEYELRKLPISSYDFAYIDGCHYAPSFLTDAVLTFYLIKPGGMIIFDDYLEHMDEPPTRRPHEAIDAFLNLFADHLRVVAKEGQVCVVKTSEIIPDIIDQISAREKNKKNK